MKLNRRFMLGYDVLVLGGLVIQYVILGPQLFGSGLLYYLLTGSIVLLLFVVNKRTFLHPTPLEVVSQLINTIVAHHFMRPYESYDKADVKYVTTRFLKSREFEQFYSEEFDYTQTSETHASVKLKLALVHNSYKKVTVIIKVNDAKFIRFIIIKEAKSIFTSFLYDWKLDRMQYCTPGAFDQAKRAIKSE